MTPSSSEPGSGQSNATSRSLLERIKIHDESAWTRLVSLYGPLVLGWCRRSGLQEQDAADVFQEVFQTVAGHVADFRKERRGDTFRGWLRVITRNKIHDHFRKLGKETRAAGGSEARLWFANVSSPEESAGSSVGDKADEKSLISRGLDLIRDEFEERTWQAFWGTAVDGRAAPEVAAELSMTPGAVRVAKSRVLHRLREELGDQD
jgi:RNA polymerase sigma-70 factor (ECF subfamily)